MANSGILWIDWTFNIAVRWLYAWADFFNITYEEINVWIFVIIGPVVLITSLVINFVQWRKLKNLS